MAARRHQTTADFRPPRLDHSPSTATSIGRYATARLDGNAQPPPGPERNNSAPMRPRLSHRNNQTNFTNNTHFTNASKLTHPTNAAEDPGSRVEKKQEQGVDVANEYFALNPWYNQQKEKPVFGLAQPLPRTVRRGMLWGRSDQHKNVKKGNEEAPPDYDQSANGPDDAHNEFDQGEPKRTKMLELY
jgi:aquaglyceroporin related protein, other eukaryote